MKLFLSLTFFLFYFSTNAQKKITYKVKIDTAGKVNIQSSNVTIIKADTVFIGQVIINQTLKSKIYFLGSTTTKDSLGIYTTAYLFAPLDNPGFFYANIQIKFDKPILPMDGPMPYRVTGLGKGTMQENSDCNEDLTSISTRAQVTGDGMAILVKSKTPLFATIMGVDGRRN